MPLLIYLERTSGLRLVRINSAYAVNLLEKHFDGWVLFFRIMLFVVAAVLIYFGLQDLRG